MLLRVRLRLVIMNDDTPTLLRLHMLSFFEKFFQAGMEGTRRVSVCIFFLLFDNIILDSLIRKIPSWKITHTRARWHTKSKKSDGNYEIIPVLCSFSPPCGSSRCSSHSWLPLDCDSSRRCIDDDIEHLNESGRNERIERDLVGDFIFSVVVVACTCVVRDHRARLCINSKNWTTIRELRAKNWREERSGYMLE